MISRLCSIAALVVAAVSLPAHAEPIIYPAGGQNAEQQQQLAGQQQAVADNQQQQMDDYYRAYGACMTGRGYTVN